MNKTIVFDFDGVIHSYKSGWAGAPTLILDEPVKGIANVVYTLRETGYRVVVQSTRCNTEAGRRAVSRYLLSHSIFVDDVVANKPPALAYVDDRAIRFNGDASTLYKDIINNLGSWVKDTKERKVFLGGTCPSHGTLDWRDELIPLLEELNIPYFNPVVKGWNEEAREEEYRQKNLICNTELYVITPDMRGCFSIAEATHAAHVKGKRCVFMLLDEKKYTMNYGAQRISHFDKSTKKSLEAVEDLIKRIGGTVVRGDMQDLVRAISKVIK